MSQEVVRGDPFCVVFFMGPFGTVILGYPFCNNVSGSGSGRAILCCILRGALWDRNSGISILYCILRGAQWVPNSGGINFVIMSQEVVQGEPCDSDRRVGYLCSGSPWGPNAGRAILYCILHGALIRRAILYCILHGALWGPNSEKATPVAGPGSVLLCLRSDSDRRVGHHCSGSPWVSVGP